MATRTNIRDRIWVRKSFLLSPEALTDADIAQRAMTSASLKFTDTTLGGNFVFNPPPQFCRYADINASRGAKSVVWAPSMGGLMGAEPELGLTKARMTNSRGMGRLYSEMIDDNGQVVTMRFGVPQYNSFVQFFGNFYDPTSSMLARTGRGPGFIFTAFKLAGLALALPWQPVILAGRVYRRLGNIPASKFYYLKPTMHTYWNAVSTIANGIGLNLGITPMSMTKGQKGVMELETNDYSSGELKKFHEAMPDFIAPDGTFDVRAIASRAQRLANVYNTRVRNKLDRFEATPANAANAAANEEALRKVFQEIHDEGLNNAATISDPGSISQSNYVQNYLDIEGNSPTGADGKINTDMVEAATTPMGGDPKNGQSRGQYDIEGPDMAYESSGMPAEQGRWDKVVSWGKSFWEFHQAENRDGSAWVSFRVDYNSTQNESFSNATRPHDMAGQMNSMSQQNRTTRINFSEGNVGDGIIASAIEASVGAAKAAVLGLASGVQLAGLAALAGNALVDVPNIVDGSTAQLPRLDCTIQLRSPYGNKLALMRNIYIPLATLLAGVLPISHGSHAYGVPFLCEAYCQGRAAIRLGVIDNMTITRGTGNVGWNQDRQALGIDVTFSIVDLSTMLHMPISANMRTLGDGVVMGVGSAVNWLTNSEKGSEYASAIAPSTYDEDSAFTDYLAVLGSLSHPDMTYGTRRWYMNRMRTMRNWKDQFTPASMAQAFTYGTMPGRMLNAVSRDSDRSR